MAANERQLAKLDRIEALLRRAEEPGRIHHASNVAWAIAQSASSGCVAELARRLVTALNVNASPEANVEYLATLHTALESLRYALEHESPGEDVVS